MLTAHVLFVFFPFFLFSNSIIVRYSTSSVVYNIVDYYNIYTLYVYIIYIGMNVYTLVRHGFIYDLFFSFLRRREGWRLLFSLCLFSRRKNYSRVLYKVHTQTHGNNTTQTARYYMSTLSEPKTRRLDGGKTSHVWRWCVYIDAALSSLCFSQKEINKMQKNEFKKKR